MKYLYIQTLFFVVQYLHKLKVLFFAYMQTKESFGNILLRKEKKSVKVSCFVCGATIENYTDGTSICDRCKSENKKIREPFRLSHPRIEPLRKELTENDIWGEFDENHVRINDGMIVGRHRERCPVWQDIIGYKSVTVICKSDQEIEVSYWLEYVHGANSVKKRKDLGNSRIALRSDYQCW